MPSRFVENDDEAKSVLNYYYHLFLFETFCLYLTMSLLEGEFLKFYPNQYYFDVLRTCKLR